jgi:hypothetical protein
MQQRQLRLGDILDDYCPRERRVTNHAVVAMVGDDVKQTRCTTCDADHEYKHAKVPRQRRKTDSPSALFAQVAATGPKRVAHESPSAAAAAGDTSSSSGREEAREEAQEADDPVDAPAAGEPIAAGGGGPSTNGDAPGDQREPAENSDAESSDNGDRDEQDEGPVHRPLIRASLPRHEGQQPPARPIPEFTIRQPGGRPNRFRPRHQHGAGQQFQGNRSSGNMPSRGPRQGGGHQPSMKRHGPGGGGRKRSR